MNKWMQKSEGLMRTSTLAVYAILAASVLAGCATEPGNLDPYERTNRDIYRFNDCLVLAPRGVTFVAQIQPLS
jgi:ABC-type transporter lipoprotein component MlaA